MNYLEHYLGKLSISPQPSASAGLIESKVYITDKMDGCREAFSDRNAAAVYAQQGLLAGYMMVEHPNLMGCTWDDFFEMVAEKADKTLRAFCKSDKQTGE